MELAHQNEMRASPESRWISLEGFGRGGLSADVAIQGYVPVAARSAVSPSSSTLDFASALPMRRTGNGACGAPYEGPLTRALTAS
jgi:hypothetical protein